MDVSFVWNRDTKRHAIEFDGEHGLLTRFVNDECDVNSGPLTVLQQLISDLSEEKSLRLQFSEWVLDLDGEEATLVVSAALSSNSDVLEEGMLEIDSQLQFGRVDLLQALDSWLDFIEQQDGKR